MSDASVNLIIPKEWDSSVVEDDVFVSVVVSLEEKKCGRWCLRVCCGVFLEKEKTCFEDRERSLEEIKVLFFYTSYFWTVAFISLVVISYPNFLVLFSSSI